MFRGPDSLAEATGEEVSVVVMTLVFANDHSPGATPVVARRTEEGVEVLLGHPALRTADWACEAHEVPRDGHCPLRQRIALEAGLRREPDEQARRLAPPHRAVDHRYGVQPIGEALRGEPVESRGVHTLEALRAAPAHQELRGGACVPSGHEVGVPVGEVVSIGAGSYIPVIGGVGDRAASSEVVEDQHDEVRHICGTRIHTLLVHRELAGGVHGGGKGR